MIILDDTPIQTHFRVLVVEGDAEQRDLLKELLCLFGYDVEGAADGLSALAAVGRHRPEVVMMGITLPGIDGYETARRMRALPWGWHVRLIAFTGWDEPAKALAAGFDVHVCKPDVHALLEQLAQSVPQKVRVAVPHGNPTTIVLPPRRKRLLRRLQRGP